MSHVDSLGFERRRFLGSLRQRRLVFMEKVSNIKRNEKKTTTAALHGTPCPLMLEGICTVYKSRPFACRKRVSMAASSDWCRVEVVQDHQLPMVHFAEIDRSFDLIVLHSQMIKSADIREFF